MEGNLAVVTLNILEINRPPVVQSSSFSLVEDGKLAIKLSASDPNGDKLTFSITQNPSQGKLTGKGPSYEYTPNKDFYGVDSFLVVANDGELDSNATLISLKVEGKNDAPNFVQSLNALSTGLRETPFHLKVEVEDVDNDELTLTISKGPQNGDCYFDEQNLVYLPKPGFEGVEEIVLELSDGKATVQNTFPISIARHENPIPIHFDDSQNSDLLNMLYQANEVLALNAERILELSAESKESELKATYVDNLGKGEMDLTTWIEKMKNGDVEGDYDFCATEKDNALNWKVAPSLDPASSLDTDLNDKSSSMDNESKHIADDVSDESSTESSKDDLAQSNQENEATTEPTASSVSEEPNTDNSETDTKKDQINQPIAVKTETQESKSEEDSKEEESFEASFITELGSGWYEAPGIGTFYDAGNGWIYEPNLGWSFLKTCPSNCSAWLFNENLGWLWFDAELPNMTFANNNGSPSWIFYPESTFGESNLVYDYTQNSWMQWK